VWTGLKRRQFTGVARPVASDSDVHVFDVDGSIELALAVVSYVICTADSLAIATVADCLQTLSHVEIVAHSAFQVLSTSTVHSI